MAHEEREVAKAAKVAEVGAKAPMAEATKGLVPKPIPLIPWYPLLVQLEPHLLLAQFALGAAKLDMFKKTASPIGTLMVPNLPPQSQQKYLRM